MRHDLHICIDIKCQLGPSTTEKRQNGDGSQSIKRPDELLTNVSFETFWFSPESVRGKASLSAESFKKPSDLPMTFIHVISSGMSTSVQIDFFNCPIVVSLQTLLLQRRAQECCSFTLTDKRMSPACFSSFDCSRKLTFDFFVVKKSPRKCSKIKQKTALQLMKWTAVCHEYRDGISSSSASSSHLNLTISGRHEKLV